MGDECYWQARSTGDCYIVIANLVISIAIGVFSGRYYKLASSYLRQRIYYIYIGVAVWVVCINIAKNVFSLAVFYSMLEGDQLDSYYQQVFMVLDTIPSIVIQTLFLVIPYNMWVNILGLLARMNITRTLLQTQFVVWLLYYLVIRFVLLLLPLVAIFMVSQTVAFQLNFVELGLQLFDSLVCSGILFFSVAVFRSKFEQIRLTAKDQKQLICEYYLMAVCSILRFAVDLIFLLIFPPDIERCMQSMENHMKFSIVYLLLATILTHFLPISVIIYVYRPQQEESDNQQDIY